MLQNLVERLGLVLHVLVLQDERRECVLHVGLRVQCVGEFARYDVSLEESRAVEHVARSLDECGGQCIRVATSHEFAWHKEQAWQFERHVGTVFIGVEFGACAVGLVSCLPFIRAFEVDGEFLTAAESVVLGESECDARAHSSRSLAHEVGFERHVVGFVEHASEGHVESVAC